MDVRPALYSAIVQIPPGQLGESREPKSSKCGASGWKTFHTTGERESLENKTAPRGHLCGGRECRFSSRHADSAGLFRTPTLRRSSAARLPAVAPALTNQL